MSLWLIFVCFGMPVVVQALETGGFASSGSGDRVIYLNEEKKFLDDFDAQKISILRNSAWRESSKGSFVLDLSKSKNPNGELRPLKFVMTPQEKNFRLWNLYVQEKINHEWVYKYKGSPLGYVENREGQEPKFVSYLNSTNIQHVLGQLKISYLTANSTNEVPADLDQFADQHPSATAGLICSELIEENFSNKDQYKMIPTVFDSFDPNVAGTIGNGKNYLAKKRAMKGSIGASASLLSSRNLKSNDVALTSLYQKSITSAFETTLMAVVNFQHRFYGSLDAQTWKNELLSTKNLQEKTIDSPRYQKLIQEQLPVVLKQVPVKITAGQMQKAIVQFNALHQSIDHSCAQAHQKYLNSSASQRPVFLEEKTYTSSDREMRNQNRTHGVARENLQAMYKKQIIPKIKAMIDSNDLKILFGSKKFQNKIGSFESKKCIETGKSGLNQISLADVYLGMDESRKNLFASLDYRIQEYGAEMSEYAQIIAKYIVSYPMMIKTINHQIKTFNGQDLDELRISCNVINNIYQDEKFERYVDYGFMGVAFIAGALTAGAGTAVVLTVMGGLTAIEATEAGLDWYKGYQLEGDGRKGLLVGSNTVIGSQDVVNRAKSIQTQAKWDFALTLASFGVGDIGGEMYKASKNTTKVATKNADMMTKSADGVVPIQPIGSKSDDMIPPTTSIKNPVNKFETIDVKIAAGKNGKQATKISQEFSHEFVVASQKIQKKFGDQYQLLHIQNGDGLVFNPEGKLQKLFIHEELLELEEVVAKKTIGRVTWEAQGNTIAKFIKLDDGITLEILNQPRQIKIHLPNGKKIITKMDHEMDDYMRVFMQTVEDQGVNLTEGFIFRSGNKIILVKPDGTILKGKRIGAEVVFSNHAEEVYVGAYRHPIFTIDREKWGSPTQWQRVSWDGNSSDLTGFEVPTVKDDGIPTGFGDINCSGLSFSGDAWLSKKSPLSCALPDSYFKDIVGVNKGLEELVGKSPTVTPQNAALHYNSTHEIFDDYISAHDRLMKMEDGGTALVYVKDTNGFSHVHNAKKEGRVVVYYDFQARTISTDPKAQFFSNRSNKIDIVETTKYHQSNNLLPFKKNATKELNLDDQLESFKPDDIAKPEFGIIGPVVPSQHDKILSRMMDQRKKLMDEMDGEVLTTIQAWDRFELGMDELKKQLHTLGYSKTDEYVDLFSRIIHQNNQLVEQVKKKLSVANIQFVEKTSRNGSKRLQIHLPKKHSWMKYMDQHFPKSDELPTLIFEPRKSPREGLSYLGKHTYGINDGALEKLTKDQMVADLFRMEVAESIKMPRLSEIKWVKGKVPLEKLDQFYKKQLNLLDYDLRAFNQKPEVEKFYKIVNSMPEADRQELIHVLHSFSKYQLCLTIDGVSKIADDHFALAYMYYLRHKKSFALSGIVLEGSKNLNNNFKMLPLANMEDFKKTPFFRDRELMGNMYIPPDEIHFAPDELYRLLTSDQNILQGIENEARNVYIIQEIRNTEQANVYQVLAMHADEGEVLLIMTRKGDQFEFKRIPGTG